MILTVADTAEKLERIRRAFADLHFFTYCALTEEMTDALREYKPTILYIDKSEYSVSFCETLALIAAQNPKIVIICVCDPSEQGESNLPSVIRLPHLRSYRSLVLSVAYYAPESANASPLCKQNCIVHGLLFSAEPKDIRLCGKRLTTLTPSEAYLLRYLAEIHPRRARSEELARLCYGYGKCVSSAAVAATVKRINQKASPILRFRPLITFQKEEGFQIDF